MTKAPTGYDELIFQYDRCLISENHNLSPLSELELVMEDEDDLPFYPLFTSLRFSVHEEEINGHLFEISVKRATLTVESEGYKVDQKHRHSDNVAKPKTSKVKRQATSSKTSNKSLDVSGEAGVENLSPKALASLKGGISGGKNIQYSVTEEYEVLDSNITVATGNRWIVGSSTSTNPLERLIIDTETLCRLIPKKGANASSVTVSVAALPRDFIFKRISEKKPGRLSNKQTSNDKLLKAFAVKEIRESHRSPNKSPQLCLSVSYIADHRE